MENMRISTTGSFPDELNASKLIMRPEQVAEEHFDPCLVQMDCRYDEAPLREFVRVPENASPHRAGQECEIAAVMIVCHDPSRDGARAIRCGWHRDHRRAYRPDTSAPSTKVAHAAHEQRPSRRVRFESIRHHESDALATFGASHGCTHLVTEHLSCSSRRNSATLPAIAPIHQAKAVDLAVIARCLDQALPTSAEALPDTGERRVKGNLDLILQIQVGLRQQSQQSHQAGGKLIQQISLH